MRRFIFGIGYAVLLAVFTVYVLLDSFVITKIYSGVQPDGGEQEAPEETVGEAVITDRSYQDENISISITEYREHDTDIYVADIRLSSVDYLRTALAQDAYGKNVTEKTSKIAKRNQAILAINGDYYGSQEHGYVLRNGVLYRSNVSADQDDLAIMEDGSFLHFQEGSIAAQELQDDGALQIFSFGPSLIEDGVITLSGLEERHKPTSDNPRTAIGYVDKLHYVFVVCDGRTKESEGLTFQELANFMLSLGVKDAYNLDGGGSATMYFNGEVINKPTTNGRSIKERSVSDIVYIGY